MMPRLPPTALDFEVELFAKPVAGRLRTHPGYQAIQVIPGIGPVLVGVFVAEIGLITRFGARAAGLLGRADPETTTARSRQGGCVRHCATSTRTYGNDSCGWVCWRCCTLLLYRLRLPGSLDAARLL